MQGIGRCDIDASTQHSHQVAAEARQVEEAPPAFKLHEKVDVAARPGLAASDGAEHTRMHDPMPAHRRRHFPSNFLDGGTHGVKSTPAGWNGPPDQRSNTSGRAVRSASCRSNGLRVSGIRAHHIHVSIQWPGANGHSERVLDGRRVGRARHGSPVPAAMPPITKNFLSLPVPRCTGRVGACLGRDGARRRRSTGLHLYWKAPSRRSLPRRSRS